MTSRVVLATHNEHKVHELQEILGAADLDVEVFALPNLGGVNIVIHGLLGEGVAASTRFDPQAKGLAEWLRSRRIDMPADIADTGIDVEESAL